MRKRRSKASRVVPPPRLNERLSTLGKELDRALETPAPAPEAPAPEEETAAGTVQGSELAPERPYRHLDVPEAEVVIIRRERAAPALRDKPAAGEVPHAAARQSAEPLHKQPPAIGAEGAPRANFDGVVEEASVVIIRRPPRERTP